MKLRPLSTSILAVLVAPAALFATDSAAIRAPLHGTGDPDAAGVVLAALTAKKSELIVSARNLAASHSYAVEVGGIVEGSVTTDRRGRAGIRFRTPVQKNVPVLDFDPRGQALRLLDGTTSVLEGVISGAGEDKGGIVNELAELSPDDSHANAHGRVHFTELRNGRSILRVDLSGLDDTPLKVFVDGVERGEVHRRGRCGVAIFDSAARGTTPVLDFDPRASEVDIVGDDRIVFSGHVEAQVPGVNVAAPGAIRLAIPSTGADADATASARLRIDDRARKHFSVEVENVPAGAYDLLVDGASVGTIQVVAVTGGMEGEIEFAAGDDDSRELPLTFDPVGKTLAIVQAQTVFFQGAFNPNLSGAGTPQAEAPSQLDENLTSTGLDADAGAHARYVVDDKGRHKFSVEVENVEASSYTLSVAGVVRGTIKATLVAGTVKGEVEFSTAEGADDRIVKRASKGGDDHGGTTTGTTTGGTNNSMELPLNFDPRGQTIEISSNDGVFFSHLFGNGSASVSGAAVTPFDTEVALFNSGAAPGAKAKAELRQREDGEQKFEVEIEDAPAGNYDLVVGGVVRATLSVVASGQNTRGKIEFESQPVSDELALNFAVAGQDVVIQQSAVTFFSRTFPTP